MLSINSSVQGIQKSTNDFNKSADKISKLNLPNNDDSDDLITNIEDKITLTNNNEVDLTQEFLKMELSEVCYKANAKVLKTSNELTGTIINTKV